MSKPELFASAILAIATACVVTLTVACDNNTRPATRTFRGIDVPVGGGTVRTEVIAEGDNITSISAVLTESALTNLPATLPTNEFILPMPAGSRATVVKHVGLNWNPQGHPPPMVYTVPHFDTHF